MRRLYCDECGNEITDQEEYREITLERIVDKKDHQRYTQDLCAECYSKALKERMWVEW